MKKFFAIRKTQVLLYNLKKGLCLNVLYYDLSIANWEIYTCLRWAGKAWQKFFCDTIGTEISENNELEIFKLTKAWLERYFRGEKPEIAELSLAPMGNDFRQRVWQLLCEIPYGEVWTYGDLAKIIAKEQGKTRMSAQAIGGAVGHNPVSIIIPCHRVVGANGSLTGYAGGIQTKLVLLKLEGVNVGNLFEPKK